MKIFYTCIPSLLVPMALFAQLNGTYTIGGSTPDYTTFNDALLDLEALGISGPVTFNVRDGVYNEQLSIGPIIGTSTTDRISFISESNDSSLVVLENPGNNLVLDSAMYMDFLQLTFRATGTTLSRLVYVQGTTGSIVFESCVFDGFDTPSIFESRLVEFSSAEENGDMTFRNNIFSSGAQGLFIYGDGSTVAAWNNLVEGNYFIDQQNRALLCQTQANLTVKNNTIISNSTMYTGGMFFQWCDNNTQVSANQINIERGYGMKLLNSDGNGANPILLANNMISHACFSTFNTGLYIQNSNYVRTYYNNVNMYGNDPLSAALRIELSFSDDDNRSKNNCLKNNALGTAITVENTQFFDQSDYNNFYTNGGTLGNYNGSGYSDLAAWQGATSDDANSVSMDPLYVSDLDLHMTTALFNGLAIPVSGVDEDFDGDPRDLIVPDIGADEIDLNVTVEEFSAVNNILIYPNPTKDLIYFETKDIDRIRCTDVYGRSVSVEFAPDQSSIDLSDLASGTYLLQIELNDIIFIEKVIVQ